MSSDPMMAPTSSAPSTPSPPPVALHLHASSWQSWGTKEAGQSGGEGGANSATDSSQSSVVPSSVSVIAAVLATLTVATASVVYKSFQLRNRSRRMQRSQSTAPDRLRTRHVEASNSLYTSDITMDTIRAATPLSRSTPRSNSTTDCCSTSGGGCNSTAAHVAAGENPSSTAALDSGLAEDSDFEEGVVGKPLPLAPLMDTTADAGALSDNRDMRLPPSSAPPLQMAHSSRTGLHNRRATPASPAAPLPPPRETPRVLLSNYYDLEPYVLQGLAGGAHGWKRVFGLLKSDMRMGSGRGEACAEDGSASAAGAPGRRAPGSLTRTCDGSNITTGETQALLQERLSPVAPITAAALTKPQTRGASAAASTCHNVAVHSDASVQNSVPEKSVATGKLRAARSCGDDQKLFSLAANFSTPASTPSPPSHPSRPSLSPVAGGPSPPSRFLNSFFFPVLQHLSSCVGRSVGSGLGDSTTTTETTPGTAGSSMHTTSTTNTFVTSAALAVAQRNLQRDISTLVAATASVRLGASASSSFSGSHVHTARCSAVPSVAVSPRVGTTRSCKSQQQHEGVTAAVPCSSFAALYEGSSTGNGGRRKRVAVEGEEGEAQQHQCVCSSRLHQSSDSRCQNSASLQDSDFNVTWYSGGLCEQNIRRPVQERTMLPHTIPCAAAAAAAAACTTADGGALPVQLEASFTEAATAAGTESTGEPVSPPTVTPRCTIAEQLAVLTSRREQQHRYTQQLQASRGSAGIGTGVVNTLPSALPTTSPSVHTGAAAAPTVMDFTGAAFSGSTAGAHSSFAWTSQHYTDTAPGVLHPSVLQLRHYENHAYSDITTEVQQCRRRCRRDCVASLGASATAAVRADAEDEDAGDEAHEAHTATLMLREAGITAGLSKRRSVERPAVETGLTGGAHTVAARKVSVAAGATVLASGVCNASPLSHSKPLQPSNERRVDDLTVKHKDDGSASYTISLTYHDSVTGASRTVNTCALPPLRRCDTGAPLPGFSSLSGGTTVRAAARTTRLTTTSTLDSSTSAAASPSHSRSVSGGEAAPACTASSLPARPATAATMGKSLHHSQPQHVSDAEENDNASMVLSLSQVARTGDGRQRSAPHSSISVGGSLKCCNSPATVVTAGGTPSGNLGCDTVTATTTISGKINPFAAPLPPVEPQHGPRLRGVAGRSGEMAIGAFLGGGACGKVYECLNTETGQVLAAKQIVFDAKDRKLRTRLKQLELELEVLTLAARHHMRWIVGFFGAEKRGHSVLMYLEYCQHGSLLDYMVGGSHTGAAVWNASRAPVDPTPQPSRAPAGRRAGCRLDTHDNPRVTALEAGRQYIGNVDGDANCLSTAAALQGPRDVCQNHTESCAVPTTNFPEQQRQGYAQRTAAEAAADTGHASPKVLMCGRDSAEEEGYSADLRGTCLSTATPASVSSAASTVALSSSASDLMPLSEMLHPKMPSVSIEQAQCFTKQIVEGLCFLHQHNYAHLDVKTANVLVAAEDECRLADLGCAMRLQPLSPASPWQQQEGLMGVDTAVRGGANRDLDEAFSPPPYPVLVDRDAITELRGTALYMAPEMIRFESHAIGSPADVWSLGCVVMEMTTGCAPWRHIAKDKLRVLYRIGSARDELPLPPLIRIWAEKAREWLAHEGLPAAADTGKQQDEVAACAAESGSAAPAPLRISAAKVGCEVSGVDRDSDGYARDLDMVVSDTLEEPCSQRRRVDHNIYAVNDKHVSESVVDCVDKQRHRLSSVVDTSCSSCEVTATPRSSSALTPSMPARVSTPTSDTPFSSFTRAVSSTTCGLLGGLNIDGEEGLFRKQRHAMRLYVALQDFVAACVRVRPEDRSSAAELLQHPFLTLRKDDV